MNRADYAYDVLREHGKPMDYKAIATAALEKGWQTSNKTPAGSINGAINEEINAEDRRSKKRSRFKLTNEEGVYQLAEWVDELEMAIHNHNDNICEELLERIRKNLVWQDFEVLVRELLEEMGFSATGTPFAGDGGKDVVAKRYLFRNPDVIPFCSLYVEAKHWDESSIGVGIVRELRGVISSAGVEGLIITTGEIGHKAEEVANRETPRISLIDGKDLAKLLIKYGFGDRFGDDCKFVVSERLIYEKRNLPSNRKDGNSNAG